VPVRRIMSQSVLYLAVLLALGGCGAPRLAPPLPTRIVDMDVTPAEAYHHVVATMRASGGEELYADPDTGLLLATVQEAVLYVKVMPWQGGGCGVYVRGRGTGGAVEDYANRLQDGPTPAALARNRHGGRSRALVGL
jgi:hypothetical protein